MRNLSGRLAALERAQGSDLSDVQPLFITTRYHRAVVVALHRGRGMATAEQLRGEGYRVQLRCDGERITLDPPDPWTEGHGNA